MSRELIGNQRNLTGETINGLEVLHRISRVPLKYQTRCLRCGSEFPWTHVRLLEAEAGSSSSARCMFENCYVFGQKIPPKGSPTERPDHADDYPVTPAPVVKPVTVKSAPKPVDPLFLIYKRFCLASRSPEWGNREPCDFQTFKLLDGHPKDFARIVSEIETWEAEEAERQRGRDGVAQIEREIMENLFFGYGKELVLNETRR